MSTGRYQSRQHVRTRDQFATLFWAHTDRAGKSAADCWNWVGRQSGNGYGLFAFRGHRSYAHRAAYELVKGDIAEGLEIDHLCRNQMCVNPSHLEAVTPLVNTMRGESPMARHARKTTCPRGHLYDAIIVNTKGQKSRQCSKCAKAKARRDWKLKGRDARQRHYRFHRKFRAEIARATA